MAYAYTHTCTLNEFSKVSVNCNERQISIVFYMIAANKHKIILRKQHFNKNHWKLFKFSSLKIYKALGYPIYPGKNGYFIQLPCKKQQKQTKLRDI